MLGRTRTRIGARIGSPRGGGGGEVLDVELDSLADKYVPTTLAEWTTVQDAAGVGGYPVAAYDFQEAAGNLLDTIGSLDFTKTGSPVYQSPAPGWTRMGIWLDEGDVDNFAATIGAGNAESFMFLGYLTPLTDTPAGTRMVLQHPNVYAEMLATGVWRADGGSAVDSVTPFGTNAQVVVLKSDATGNVQKLYTKDEVLAPANFEDATTTFRIGGDSSNGAGVAWVMGAIWRGADAEKSDDDIRDILTTLRWTVAW